jgi:hypothetical protein
VSVPFLPLPPPFGAYPVAAPAPSAHPLRPSRFLIARGAIKGPSPRGRPVGWEGEGRGGG